MIIVRLMGGLGNQLFQYALGRRLSLENNVPLKLDISWFELHDDRQYGLDQFRISAEIATPAEINFFKQSQWRVVLRKIFRRIRAKYPSWLGQIISYQGSSFYPQALQVSKSAYLSGYWQSEMYFASIAPVIRQEFQLKTPFSIENNPWVEKVSQPFSVSVHIRRTDYVNDARYKGVFHVCSPEYYRQAADILRQQIPQAFFVIFSDDLSWTRQNLDFLSPACFVEANGPRKDEEEMMLMALCNHHIIANSSFSWWGAWLGKDKDKIVIAPKKWFVDPNCTTQDFIPENWIGL